MSESDPNIAKDVLDGWSLPAWTYDDPEFAKIEIDRVFRPSWQVVCHVSDVPNSGDWHSLDYIGESVIVVRGQDNQLRAFTNVCRHRGSRLVDGASGCAKKLVCPYHAWTYDLDGRLTGVPDSASPIRRSTRSKAGLVPVEMEIWRGFIFVRLESGGPSVAEMMAPYEAQIAPYRFEELEALGRVTLRPRDVNWKNVGDNYSDGLHIPVAHPGLTRLFGKSYGIEAEPHVDRMWGDLDRPAIGQLVGARLPEPASAGAAFARGQPAALALFQALAVGRVRYLPRSGRFHAVAADRSDKLRHPRDQLCSAR